MAKYIIDLPDEIAEASARYWKETTDMTLVPHTEPDREAIEDEVWEFVRMFLCLGNCAISEIGDDKNTTEPLWLIEKYSYQEAKSKYDAWKEEKEEIHVWDEVTAKTDTDKDMPKGIVTYNNPEQLKLKRSEEEGKQE